MTNYLPHHRRLRRWSFITDMWREPQTPPIMDVLDDARIVLDEIRHSSDVASPLRERISALQLDLIEEWERLAAVKRND